MADDLMSPTELSELTNISEKTLAQWRWRGVGPSYLKLGGHVRYRNTDVNAWLEGCRRDAAS